MKAQPKKQTAKSISAMKRNRNIYNGVPAIWSQIVSRKAVRLSTYGARNIRGRNGYYV